MPKEIWLGPVLGTNRERLLARCAEYVAKGESDRLLYIAASHPLLDLATQTVLDGRNARGVWGEFPFYLFRGFTRRVLAEALVSEPPAVTTGSGKHFAERSTPSIDSVSITTPRGLPARGPRSDRGPDTVGLTPRVLIDREEFPLRHSLISQIIKQLAEAGKLPAIRRLANRDGCVKTIATLVGELHRTAKAADEFTSIVESRATDDSQAPKSRIQSSEAKDQLPDSKSQIDFDRDVALVYSKYEEALDRFGFTDEDADQLRALLVLRRGGTSAWLDHLDLLVIDGFFDFTPVQGEMLRLLIPRIANVIVNINYDRRNEQIFQPFQTTIEQLQSMADFQLVNAKDSTEERDTRETLLRRLFNSTDDPEVTERADRMPAHRPQDAGAPAVLLECSDRETELRSIAKEIKRLIVAENYKLSDMALVVRERAAYADAILRVCEAESVPCNLERRVAANEIPCIRAAAKVFEILKDPEREHVVNPKASNLAHLIKTGYFRLSEEHLQELANVFDEQCATLLEANDDGGRNAARRFALGIGRWSPDVIESVIAYVGSELRVRAWLDRAQRLVRELPSTDAARSFIGAAEGSGEDSAVASEVEPPAPDEPAPKEKTKRPSPIHPAAIAWTMLVIERLRQTIAQTPERDAPSELRRSLMSLIEALEFPRQVRRPLAQRESGADVPQMMLNVRGLEALRRALAATVRSFEVASAVVSEARPLVLASKQNEPSATRGLSSPVSLSAFIDELDRCLKSQTLSIAAGDRDGLQVLEATDVRGLRFRAMFIAGMNEGSFPLRASRDWLYPHEERERLKQYGVVLEDISTETLLKEEHYFYQCACRATERLYLTRPLAADDGIDTVPSYYIEELRRAIAPHELRKEEIRGDIDSHNVASISNAAELAAKIVRQKARQGRRSRAENLLPAPVAEELVNRARREMYLSDSLLRRIAIEVERDGVRFGPHDGQITQRDLRKMLGSHFGEDYVYSASGLSSYGNCAFKFFASRVMRLEPRNEAALDLPAIDAGKLQRELGWVPQESFETGLRKTVRWYLDNTAWVAHVVSGEYRQWMDRNYGERK